MKANDSVKNTRAGGFTLIELLVVIAIIAILAAILFPVFANAKQTAQTTKCLSAIKQTGVAMQLYADANDGRLPPYSVGNGANRLLWSWFIKPYMRADRIYRCPGLPPKEDKRTDLDAKGTARLYGFGVPYPHLFFPAEWRDNNPPMLPTKLSSIPRSSKVMLLCDSYTISTVTDFIARTTETFEAGYPVVYCRACGDFNYTGVMPDGNVAGRHGGRSNSQPYGKTTVLYCDMHARAIAKDTVIRRYSSPSQSGHGDMWAHFDTLQH